MQKVYRGTATFVVALFASLAMNGAGYGMGLLFERVFRVLPNPFDVVEAGRIVPTDYRSLLDESPERVAFMYLAPGTMLVERDVHGRPEEVYVADAGNRFQAEVLVRTRRSGNHLLEKRIAGFAMSKAEIIPPTQGTEEKRNALWEGPRFTTYEYGEPSSRLTPGELALHLKKEESLAQLKRGDLLRITDKGEQVSGAVSGVFGNSFSVNVSGRTRWYFIDQLAHSEALVEVSR